MTKRTFDWADIVFASKKELHALDAIFIPAPREISPRRVRQLLQTYLPKGNVIIGIAREPYILGFEDQPQFRTLEQESIKSILDLVNKKSGSEHKVYTLSYAQADLVHILQKVDLRHVVMINGSWKYSFHTRDAYYVLARRKISYDMVSPFADEEEAQGYTGKVQLEIAATHLLPEAGAKLSAREMSAAAGMAARYSFDYNFQTGVALGQAVAGRPDEYAFMTAAYNKVVPYQTYAMHHGAAREKNFSPPHDLNHYDTVHAEVGLILAAAKDCINLTDTSVFINLLPCPTCSRMLADTPIKELVYNVDHSEGYAVMMLEAAGKSVRRVVTAA